jgi:antitoxin CptB
MAIQKREQMIKKLLYQSCNRGCKETDLIIGEFAKENLYKMTDEEINLFSEILQLSDADIYDWYTKKKTLPKDISNSVIIQLLNFIPYR